MRQPNLIRRRSAFAVATVATEQSRGLRVLFAVILLAVTTGLFATRAVALDSDNIRVAKAISGALAEVVDYVSPAVVGIETEKMVKTPSFSGGIDDPMGFFERFFNMPEGMGPRMRRNPDEGGTSKTSGIGSGVVIDAEGHILTNNHVVANADKIKIEFASEKGKTYQAEVVGRDPNTDIAVIKLTEKPAYLPVADLGDSDLLKPGNMVMAIGSPMGFKQSVTLGIISAKERKLGELAYERFIQTDADINPGNSGGPLVNLDGEVVGINTMISVGRGGSGSIGIGFSIPINQAKTIVRQLIEKGSVTRGWLGITMNPEDRDISIELGHDGSGVLITEVDPSGPAHKAGMRRQDLITTFDGIALRDNDHLRNMVADLAPEQVVPITVLRDGKKVNLKVTIKAQPEDLYTNARRYIGGGSGDGIDGVQEVSTSLGMTVRNLDDAARKKYEIAESVTSGVVVSEVDSTGEARTAGIRPGTVIIEMNNKPVSDVASFRRILKESAGKDKILVYLRYGEVSRYMSLKLN